MKLLPPGKIQNAEDLDRQLDTRDERWDVALIALACALFVLALAVACIAGLSFHQWKHLIGL